MHFSGGGPSCDLACVESIRSGVGLLLLGGWFACSLGMHAAEHLDLGAVAQRAYTHDSDATARQQDHNAALGLIARMWQQPGSRLCCAPGVAALPRVA